MYASGINKNTKKFAPKLLQRRKPGGSSTSPSKPDTPAAGESAQLALETPIATSTPVNEDEPSNSEEVDNTLSVTTQRSLSPAPTSISPIDSNQHEPAIDSTLSAGTGASVDSQMPASSTITELTVQEQTTEATVHGVENVVESTQPASVSPVSAPTVSASPPRVISTTQITPTVQSTELSKPFIIPTVQATLGSTVQVKPTVVSTAQASPVPAPIAISASHTPPTVIPTVRSTAPMVIAPNTEPQAPEEAEPRKRRRISVDSRPSYAPQTQDEDEEMGDLDVEELDDDQDEDCEEEHRKREESEDTTEKQGQDGDTIMTDGLNEVSQTGTTIATSINSIIGAENTNDKGKGKGKQKAKAKAPEKLPAPRKKKAPATTASASTDDPNSASPTETGEASTTAAPKKPRVPRKRRRKPATAPSALVDPDAPETTNDADPTATSTDCPPRRRGRTREVTPPNAEDIQIVPGIVKMADLCRDIKIGKKSQRFTELEKVDWTEVVRKQRAKKAQIEAARAAGEEIPPPESTEERLERLAHENATARPAPQRHAMQVRVVNGQIVLDEDTLQVDRRELVQEDGPREIVEENSLTRRVNAGTWGRREKPERWDPESTDRFYDGLGMFGTDFELISGLFPDRSRRQIKNKFNSEERKNPARVTAALKTRVAVDMDEYSRVTNTSYGDARDLDRELEEMRAQHEEEERASIEAAKELDRERREMQEASTNTTGENVIGVVQQRGKRGRGAGKQGQFISRHQGGGEEVVLGLI